MYIISPPPHTHTHTHSGFILYYTSAQILMFLFFHIASIFWGIQFPFHRQEADKAGHTKYVHLGLLLTALLLPFLCAGIPFATGGYALSRFPANVCHAKGTDTIYGVFMIPLTVILIFSVPLMFVVLLAVVKNAKSSFQHSRRRSAIRVVSHNDGYHGGIVSKFIEVLES